MLISSWPASTDAWHRTSASLAGGVSTGLRGSMKPHPLFFRGGHGAQLTDLDENTYIDFVLGWGPVILGHGHPALVEAVQTQLPLGATYGAGHLLEAEVAEKVLNRIPGAERLLWSNTGSEANQIALRLARGFTNRVRFVKFTGHYHGWSDAMLLGYRPGAEGELGLGSIGQHPRAMDDVTLLPWGDLEGLAEVLHAPDSDIAAVFLEPVLVNSGAIAAPANFLQGLRDLCDQTGTVLVFDEVITGFRIDSGGAVSRFGVRPDLVVLAKAIAGGFPLAAVAGRAAIIDRTGDGVVHAGTYNGNPIVLAAADATLDVLAGDGIYQDFERRAARLADGIRDAFARHRTPVAVHHVPSIVQCMPGIHRASTFEQFLETDQEFYDRLSVNMLRRGLFTLPGGRWYLSVAHTDQDIDVAVERLEEALTATLTEGPGPTS